MRTRAPVYLLLFKGFFHTIINPRGTSSSRQFRWQQQPLHVGWSSSKFYDKQQWMEVVCRRKGLIECEYTLSLSFCFLAPLPCPLAGNCWGRAKAKAICSAIFVVIKNSKRWWPFPSLHAAAAAVELEWGFRNNSVLPSGSDGDDVTCSSRSVTLDIPLDRWW